MPVQYDRYNPNASISRISGDAFTSGLQGLARNPNNPYSQGPQSAFTKSFSKLYDGSKPPALQSTNFGKSGIQAISSAFGNQGQTRPKLNAISSALGQSISQTLGNAGRGGIGNQLPGIDPGYHGVNLVSDLMAAQNSWSPPTAGGTGYTGTGATGQRVGSIQGFSGNNFDANSDALIQQAADAHGVPPNFLKAILVNESSGDWNGNSHSVASVRGGKRIFGYIGAFDDALYSWGITNLDALEGNQALQLDALATGLAKFYAEAKQANPAYNWLNVAVHHFSGDWTDQGYGDELGNSTSGYLSKIQDYWQMLDQAAGNSFSTDPGGGSQNFSSNPDGSLSSNTNFQQYGVGSGTSANGVIAAAQQYIGLPYVWGGIPGKGVDPRAFGGWDCSGFTYWLDQNYGTGQLPMGSHYQYQDARDRGTLFNSQAQLQPGDLVFFDTGDHSGGGGELNNASHVAMYIGNGQIIHAANPTDGTLISNFTDSYYQSRFIGAEHMSWSGGGGAQPAYNPTTSPTTQQVSQPYQRQGSVFTPTYMPGNGNRVSPFRM